MLVILVAYLISFSNQISNGEMKSGLDMKD